MCVHRRPGDNTLLQGKVASLPGRKVPWGPPPDGSGAQSSQPSPAHGQARPSLGARSIRRTVCSLVQLAVSRRMGYGLPVHFLCQKHDPWPLFSASQARLTIIGPGQGGKALGAAGRKTELGSPKGKTGSGKETAISRTAQLQQHDDLNWRIYVAVLGEGAERGRLHGEGRQIQTKNLPWDSGHPRICHEDSPPAKGVCMIINVLPWDPLQTIITDGKSVKYGF